MIGGSVIACVGVAMRAAALRRVVPFAAVLAGGLAGALTGWLLGSLWVNGSNRTLERIAASVVGPEGRWYSEWPLAVCLTPYGMWLVLLLGARKAAWVFVGGVVLEFPRKSGHRVNGYSDSSYAAGLT